MSSLSQIHKATYAKVAKQTAVVARQWFPSPRVRFQRVVRRVIGGMPVKGYVLTMKVKYRIQSQPKATYTKEHTFIYKSKASSLKQTTIDTAYEDFQAQFADEYRGSEASFEPPFDIKHKPYDEVKLKDLPLFDNRRLAFKLCPDDAVINTKHNQCAIDGLLAFLRIQWKTMSRKRLIQELGTPSPSLATIEAWLARPDLTHTHYISIYVIDPLLTCLFKHVAPLGQCRVMMTFYLNEQHLYPITDKSLRQHIADYKHLHMTRTSDGLSLTRDNFVLSPYASYDGISHCAKTPNVLVNTHDLSAIVKETLAETQTLIHQMSFNGATVRTFRHPITDQVIIASPDFHERKAVADKLYNSTSYVGFRFANQSFCDIAKASFRLSVGDLPLESYGPDQIDLFERWSIHQLIFQTKDTRREVQLLGQGYKQYSVDCRRNFTHILKSNTHPFPVFHYADKPEPYHPRMGFPAGEYYITRTIVMAQGNFTIRHGWWSLPVVRYCLDEDYISYSDISHVMKARSYLAHDTFKEWATDISQQFPKASKQLINFFVGYLGQQFYKRSEGAVSTSFETAIGTMLEYDDHSVEFTEVGSLYFIRRNTQTRRYTGHVGIHRHIVGASIVELDRMYRTITSNGTIPHYVLGMTADSIKLLMKQRPLHVKDKATCQAGEYHLEDDCRPRGQTIAELLKPYRGQTMAETMRAWQHIPKDTISLSESCAYIGAGGTGKTTQEVAFMDLAHQEGKKYITLSYTCASCQNVVCRCQTHSPHVFTFDAYFYEKKGMEQSILQASRLDYIFVEEFSTLPEKYLHLLYQVKMRNPQVKFHIFGDPNQCPPVEERWIHYMDCPLFRWLVDYRLSEFPYIHGCSRYSKELHETLVHTTATGKLHPSLHEKSLLETPFHICVKGKTRARINAEQAQQWLNNHADLKRYCVGNKTYVEGMPIISASNHKKNNIFNSNHQIENAAQTNQTRAHYLESFRDGLGTIGSDIVISEIEFRQVLVDLQRRNAHKR